MDSDYEPWSEREFDKAPDAPYEPVQHEAYKERKTQKVAKVLIWLLKAFLRLCRYAVLHA